MKRQKVIVAMSGGVDSSVAAALMVDAGYDVLGVFLKCWSQTKNMSGVCDWRLERKSAQRVCNILKIPLITVDAEKEYKQYVVEEMFKDYKRGVTPNPDVLCNEVVKFPFLLKAAKKFKADFVVTGHFARIRAGLLYRALDEMKDQSYFLYRLRKEDLKRLKFPIGNLTKKEVRAMAKKYGFLNAEKKSTVGICFIGKVPMKNFLMSKIKPKKGRIMDPKGNVLGTHDGVFYYTIGQRIGPRNDTHIKKNDSDRQNISRWYVAKKDIKRNVLVVAPAGHELLYRKGMVIKKLHLIKGQKSEFLGMITKKPMKLYARIRHVGELVSSTVWYDSEKKKVRLKLGKRLDGVSNGQAVVLYKGKRVLGGGEICF